MASPLLTLQDVREHVETELNDSALERVLVAEDEEIVARYGPHAKDGEITVVLRGCRRRIFLPRPAAAILSVIEMANGEETVLAPSDYFAWHGGRVLERLSTGLNQACDWGERVTVEFAPVSDDGRRARVLLELIKLNIAYEGVKLMRVGDTEAEWGEYYVERERVLSSLRSGYGVMP